MFAWSFLSYPWSLAPEQLWSAQRPLFYMWNFNCFFIYFIFIYPDIVSSNASIHSQSFVRSFCSSPRSEFVLSSFVTQPHLPAYFFSRSFRKMLKSTHIQLSGPQRCSYIVTTEHLHLSSLSQLLINYLAKQGPSSLLQGSSVSLEAFCKETYWNPSRWYLLCSHIC